MTAAAIAWLTLAALLTSCAAAEPPSRVVHTGTLPPEAPTVAPHVIASEPVRNRALRPPAASFLRATNDQLPLGLTVEGVRLGATVGGGLLLAVLMALAFAGVTLVDLRPAAEAEAPLEEEAPPAPAASTSIFPVEFVPSVETPPILGPPAAEPEPVAVEPIPEEPEPADLDLEPAEPELIAAVPHSSMANALSASVVHSAPAAPPTPPPTPARAGEPPPPPIEVIPQQTALPPRPLPAVRQPDPQQAESHAATTEEGPDAPSGPSLVERATQALADLATRARQVVDAGGDGRTSLTRWTSQQAHASGRLLSGTPRGAWGDFERRRSPFRDDGEFWVRGSALLRMGVQQEAERHYWSGFYQCENRGWEVEGAECLRRLGEIAMQRGELGEALRHFDAAATVFERHHDAARLRLVRQQLVSIPRGPDQPFEADVRAIESVRTAPEQNSSAR